MLSDFAALLKALDKASKVNQEAIAAGAGISTRQFTNYLAGKQRPLFPALVLLIAHMRLPTGYGGKAIHALEAAGYGLETFIPRPPIEKEDDLSIHFRCVELLLQWLIHGLQQLEAHTFDCTETENVLLKKLIAQLSGALQTAQEIRIPTLSE